MPVQNSKFKVQCKIIELGFLILTLHFALLTLNLPKAIAANTSNEEYNIELNDFSNQKEIIKAQPVTQTSPQLTKQSLISPNGGSLELFISNLLMDFGQLSPTNPVTRNIDLSVLSDLYGFQLQISENHPPQTTRSETIPNTTCDNGSCSPQEAAEWKNNLTYGFGLRCDNIVGTTCLNDFAEDFYRQVPDKSKKENDENLIESNWPTTQKAQITLKVNVSGLQTQGSYSNVINYIAVPSF